MSLVPLTKAERLLLKNQYAILEMLACAHPEVAKRGNTIYHDPTYYAWAQEVLGYGHETLTSELFERILDSSLSVDEQEEVKDILRMYDDIQTSYKVLQHKGGVTPTDLDFDGWDGNSSKGEKSFAQQYCAGGEDPNGSKYQRYAHIQPSPVLNSHRDVLPIYRRMLNVYVPIRQSISESGYRPLALEEIESVLAARKLK